MHRWHDVALIRLIIGVVCGVIVGLIVSPLLGVPAGALAGWSTAALLVSVWILVTVWPMDPARTRTHARREDPGRRVARIISVVASAASLVATGLVLVQSRSATGVETYILAGIAVISVVASWLLIQVDYMLRYAYEYYSEPHGGIDFNEQDDPQYTDFAYFALGLGMTYQVADTNVSDKGLRKIVIAQTVLAYVFATVIIATVINLVTSIGT